MRHTETIYRAIVKLTIKPLYGLTGKAIPLTITTTYPKTTAKHDPENGVTHEDRKQFFCNFDETLYKELEEIRICEQIY